MHIVKLKRSLYLNLYNGHSVGRWHLFITARLLSSKIVYSIHFNLCEQVTSIAATMGTPNMQASRYYACYSILCRVPHMAESAESTYEL